MEAINRHPTEEPRAADSLIMPATTQQSRAHRFFRWFGAPGRWLSRSRHSRALSRRDGIYEYLAKQASARDGSLRRVLPLSTFAGDYYFLIGAEEIRDLMRHPRMGEGELIGEGRQLHVVADALGRYRISKERQDAKQKRNIIAHLVSNPERHIEVMRGLSRGLVQSWRETHGPLLVNSDLSEYTVEVYLRAVMNFQGSLDGVAELLEEQVGLLGESMVYRKSAGFEARFQQLKQKLVAKIGNDPGLLTTTEYTDRLKGYIDEHYKSIQDEAFATGLNGAVLAGYIAPFPSFAALVYELGRHPAYQRALRDEAAGFQGRYADYIRRDDTLLHACVHEVLRLHPAQPFLFRATTRDAMVGGRFVAKGSELVADVYHVLRLPELWGSDAQSFRPERFREQPERYRQPFLVYSSGPNNCTGQMFSRLSLKVLLAELVEGCRWQVTNGEFKHEFHFALAMSQPVEIRTEEIGS
ncbi:cytochrome P450 [Trinickia dabaoshanensis]|uniref:Cytochrome P450 n=1 Tax=Trinickia dabaoshanensis TaxID=564714 RepID=A0A2N7W0Y4_9BURK|nr:cytochrome P450 [Trinickia dabaoshanensis]PMS23074.1 cytochrome P450 [Trinickia dabaoshanensis]